MTGEAGAPAPSAESADMPPPGRPTPEAGLVAGLFTNPRSLAAAFIAAEILAKPVSLRDP